jgi:hypothetical protein
VAGVTWWEVVKWDNLKSQLQKRDPVCHADAGKKNVCKIGSSEMHPEWYANGYRLTTEAEWELVRNQGP